MDNQYYKRFQNAKSRKHQTAETYREAQQYSMPQRDTFYGAAVEGAKRDNADVIFDSTAQDAAMKFASNLQSRLVPPMKKFVKLDVGQAVQEDQKDAALKQLEDITETMFSHLHNSNFDIQIAESFLDLAIGMGAILLQKGTRSRPFNFVSVPLSQIFLEEASDGRVGLVGREHGVSYRMIYEMWPDAKLPDEMVERAQESPDDKITLCEITVPEKVTVNRKDQNGGFSPVEVDGYRYIVMTSCGQHELVRRDIESSPWIVFRWSILPGEVYGRGPLLTALADIKTLNKTKEMTLKNAAMAISGAYLVRDDGVVNVNTMRIYPGAKIPVESTDGGAFGPSIKRLDQAGDFNVANLVIKELQTAIRGILFADPMGPIDLPVKSATEVSLRQQELASRIGSSFGRLQYELIAPLVSRMLHILDELQLVDLSGYRVDGNVIAIRHVSPLAMSQDEEALMSLMRYSEFLSNTFGPQAALVLMNPPAFVKEISRLLHINADIVPTEEQFKQFGQLAAQMLGTQVAPPQ